MANTTLDQKAMEVNRNIAGRIYWKERLSNLEWTSYFNGRRDGPADTEGSVYKDYAETASGTLYSDLNRIAGSDRAKQMVLLTALGVLAHKCASCADVCIFTNPNPEGNAGSGRENILPVRMNGFEGAGFRNCLTALTGKLREDLKNNNYPLEKILSANALKARSIPATGLLMEGMRGGEQFDGFDLDILFCFSIRDSLTLKVRYNANRYDGGQIMSLTELYFDLLSKLILHPERDVEEIELISGRQKRLILEQFNATGHANSGERSLLRLFGEMVSKVPDQTAIAFNGRQMSYGSLNTEANKVARSLIERGVQPGMPVAMLLDRSEDFVVGVLAVLKTGCPYLPLDASNPDERLRYIVEDSGAQFLLTKESMLSGRSLDAMPQQVHMERIGAEQGAEGYSDPPMTENENVYIIYTSGSTGKPKGVIGTLTGLMNRLYWGWEKYPYREGEVCCQKTSVGFVDHVVEMFSPLLMGVPLVILKEEEVADLDAMANLLLGKEISRITLVPSLLQAFIQWKMVRSADFPALQYVFCSGENLPLRLAKDFYKSFPQVKLVNIYGSTEVSADVTYYDVIEGDISKMLIGKPIFNTRILIVDNDDKMMPVGMPGEILISGDGIMAGYLNSPELSAERIIQHPFFGGSKAFRSGDIGRWCADGNIEYLGRLDDQVKIRGRRIRLTEIENVLLGYEGIGKSVVVVNRAGGDERLVCYYLSDLDINADELKHYLLGKLPAFMVPSYFVQLASFPLTPSGKTDRAALPAPEMRANEEYIAPSGELEKKVTAIWAEILKMDAAEISTGAGFFELGGHSISAMALTNRIFAELKIEISVKEVFERKNISNLCKLLSAKQENSRFFLRKAESREYYKLSIAQQRLYYLVELERQSLKYNLPSVQRLEGALDKKRLNDAFCRLVQRHEALRTAIIVVNNEPVQILLEKVEFGIRHINATEAELDTVIGEFIKPFDLSVAPLLRVGLVEISPEVHILLVDLHHIISDGTSLALLVKDFVSLYYDMELPHLELDYKDYAVWQQSNAYKIKTQTQKDFWVREFSEPIVPLDIPADFSRPPTQDGDEVILDLSKETSRKLKDIAEKEAATNAMVILSILTILLSKISGQDDLVVGVAVAGREQLELENMIGMFPLVLPLRAYPKAGLNFQEFLDAVKSKFLEILLNQSYQYEELAKELNLERNTSGNPWFDVMFLYQNFETTDASFPDLKISTYHGHSIAAAEKIVVMVWEEFEQIHVRFIYSTALFTRRTIERFTGYFERIVNAVTGCLDVKIGDIEIIGDEEKGRLLNSFSAAAAIDRTKCFSELFRKQTEMTPSRVAVEHNGTKLTYNALLRTSTRLGTCLKAEGLKTGSNVALFMPRGIEMLKSILATFHCGCAYVPIDVEFPAQRILEIIAESEARIVVTTREMMPVIREMQLSVPEMTRVVFSDQLDEKEPVAEYETEQSTDDLAYIIYTSGTTGKPKGVLTHHLGMINHMYALIEVLGLNENDVIAQTASPCFDISVWQFLTALLTGGRTLIIDKEAVYEPEELMRTLKDGNVTIFQSVPSLMTAFLNNLPAANDNVLPKLRWMIICGEVLMTPLVTDWYSRYPAIPLLNAYGPAEASDDVTTYVVARPSEGQLSTIPVGQAVRNMRVYILTETLRLCPVGVKGEICCAGIGVGKGYWKDEDKTRKAFVPNPFVDKDADPDYSVLYKTGDIGYYLEDGNIVCLGRKDDQVKIRGVRIELGEIAGWLLKHPAIRETIVLVKQKAGDKYLVAYYVADKEIPVVELQNHLSEHLPFHMIPSYFMHLSQLPLTSNAKLDKRLLPDIKVRAEDEYVAPSNPTEKRLAEIWLKILKPDTGKISVIANFFGLGGHSLNVITLIGEVQREFGVTISMRDFFQRPTIAFMAKLIERTQIPADVAC